MGEIADRVANRYSKVDYVLIDFSGGKKLEFDEKYVSKLYGALSAVTNGQAIGIAGGLSGDNAAEKLTLLTDILRTWKFSIDAEGGLRDESDVLSMAKVEHYLKEVARVLR